MAFSFFTKRTEYTSKRLRFVARALQVFGIGGGISLGVIAYSVSQSFFNVWPEEIRETFVRGKLLTAAAMCASYWIIGRSLLRRQRSGAYAAAAIIGLPLIYDAFMLVYFPAPPMALTAVTFGLRVLALGAVGSVWKELGTVRESELFKQGAAPESVAPFTPRNRGFGEARTSAQPKLPAGSYAEPARGLARDTMPATTNIAANTPLPTNNPRAH